MDKMWSGRFSASASTLLDQFNASIMFDRKLYREDIEGSLAQQAIDVSFSTVSLRSGPVN